MSTCKGKYLGERLEQMKATYACVGDVRYKGLFSAIDFVKDKVTKEPLAPFNGTSPEMARLAAHLKAQHLYAFSRFNMLWICPPLVITQEELVHGLDVIEKGLESLETEAHHELATR